MKEFTITTRMLLPSLICASIGLASEVYELYTMDDAPSSSEEYILDAPEESVFSPTLIPNAEGRPKAEIRLTRFHTTNQPIPLYYWDGRSAMSEKKLRQVVKSVLTWMPHIPNSEHIENLVVETGTVETNRGIFVKAWRSKGDYGVFQVRGTTAKCTLEWLKAAHRDVYHAVMGFYDRKQSWEANLDHNVPFGAALCISYYWRTAPNAKIDTMERRANVWVKYYNTYLGKGTVKAYLKRNRKEA